MDEPQSSAREGGLTHREVHGLCQERLGGAETDLARIELSRRQVDPIHRLHTACTRDVVVQIPSLQLHTVDMFAVQIVSLQPETVSSCQQG